MAWIFKPYSYISYSGQIVYPIIDYTIEDTILKYLQSVTQNTVPQIKLYNSGFVSKAFRINSSIDYYIKFNFTFSNKTPRTIIESIKSFIRGLNGAGIGIRFNDTFMNGTTLSPVVYICRFGNIVDSSDSNILTSMLAFNIFVFGEN